MMVHGGIAATEEEVLTVWLFSFNSAGGSPNATNPIETSHLTEVSDTLACGDKLRLDMLIQNLYHSGCRRDHAT